MAVKKVTLKENGPEFGKRSADEILENIERQNEKLINGRNRGGVARLLGAGVPLFMLVMGFALGSLWTKVKFLENGTTGTPNTAGQQVQPQQVKVTEQQVRDAYSKAVIKFGDANSKLAFIEFADPSCPYCHVAAGKNPELNKQAGSQFQLVSDGGTYTPPVEEMKKLVDQGQASFVWMYTPGHGNGELGTIAMYCAHEQGKFWPVHDLLMSSAGYDLLNEQVKNDKTKSQQIASFLSRAADATRLKQCIDSGKYDGKLDEETQIAGSMGIQGTPGFFVNTKAFNGAYSYSDMKADVEAAL